MSKADGGQAFPIPRPHYSTPGMTLRDWFAGQALVAMEYFGHIDDGSVTPAIARRAYLIADAMLEERSK